MEVKVWSDRWRLAKLENGDFVRIGLWSAIVGMIFVLFHCQGNTTDLSHFGRSALLWMVSYWNDAAAFGGADYSHGWLIPIGSIFLIWLRRNEIRLAERRISYLGLLVVVLALLLHWAGAKSQQTRVSLLGLVTLTWALPFYFCGWQVARQILFPCAYLIFCIPLNFLEDMTTPLRMVATVCSTALLNGLGCHVENTGFAIKSVGSDAVQLDVADPCSGIRSLLALAALTSFYGSLTQRSQWKKWLLFFSAMPLAMIGNIARITSVGLISQAFGNRLAEYAHDYNGYIVFAVALGLMLVIGNLLNMNLHEVRERWRHALLSPTS